MSTIAEFIFAPFLVATEPERSGPPVENIHKTLVLVPKLIGTLANNPHHLLLRVFNNSLPFKLPYPYQVAGQQFFAIDHAVDSDSIRQTGGTVK
jgi:hypothetical protein